MNEKTIRLNKFLAKAGKELVWKHASSQLAKREIEKGLSSEEAKAIAEKQLLDLKDKFAKAAVKDMERQLPPKALEKYMKKQLKKATAEEIAKFISKETGMVIEIPTFSATVKSVPAALKKEWTKFFKGRMAAELKREIRYERYGEILGLINPEKEVVDKFKNDAINGLVAATNMTKKAATEEVDKLLAEGSERFPSRIAENFNSMFKDAGLEIEDAAKLCKGGKSSLYSPDNSLIKEMKTKLVGYYSSHPEKIAYSSAEAQAEADIISILRETFANELNIISAELSSRGAAVAPNLRPLYQFTEMKAERMLLKQKEAKLDFLLSDEIKHFKKLEMAIPKDGMTAEVRITMRELREAMNETWRLLFKEPLGFGKKGKTERATKLKKKWESDVKKLREKKQNLEDEMNAINNKINSSERGKKLWENRKKLEELKKKHSETSIESEQKNLRNEIEAIERNIREDEEALRETEDGKNLAKLEKTSKAISAAIASTEKFMEMEEARFLSIATTYTASVFKTMWKTGAKHLPPRLAQKWMSDVLDYLNKANLIAKYKDLGKELAKISPDVAMLDRKISDAFMDYAKQYCEKKSLKIGELSAGEAAKIRNEFFMLIQNL